MDYGKILRSSFEITKKYKVLWIFGLLMVSGGGGGAGNSGSGFSEAGTSLQQHPDAERWLLDVRDFVVDYWWVLAILAAALLFFMLICLIIGIAAKGALYKGAHTASQGEEKVGFWNHFGFGFHKFWRVLGIDVLTFLIVLAVLFGLGLLSIPFLIFFLVPVIGWIVFILYVFLAIIVVFLAAALITMFINYVYCYALIEDMKIGESFRRGWALMKDNFGSTLVMALILFGVTFAFALFALLVIFLIFIPLFVIGMLLYHAMGLWGGIITGILALLVLFVFALLIKGVRNTYVVSAWVLTWKELSGTIAGKTRAKKSAKAGKKRSKKKKKTAKNPKQKPAKK